MTTKFEIDEKDIALFVSGELSNAKARRVQAEIDKDEALAAYISELRGVDQLLTDQLAKQYPVPDDFRDLVTERLEANELGLFAKLSKNIGLISLFSGGIGAGLAIILMSTFTAPILLTRSSPDIEVNANNNEASFFEATIWERTDDLLVNAHILQSTSSGKQKLSRTQTNVQEGDELQIEILSLVTGTIIIRYVSADETIEIFRDSFRDAEQRLIFNPGQLPKFRGPGEDEIQILLNKELQISYPIKISNIN